MLKNKSTYKYLDFVKFSQLYNWSVQYLNDSKIRFTTKYPLVQIKEFLTRNKTAITVQDEITYQRVTIRIRNGGVILRDEVKGTEIGTKKQFRVSAGQFILSKIDARNGAMGIIPENLDGAIVTQDFLAYDIDTTKINPQYLVLVSTTKQFIDFCQSCSSGTTNRQRVDENKFLNIQIPLPLLAEQNKLVEEYTSKINEYNTLLAHILELDQEFTMELANLLKQNTIVSKSKNNRLGLLHEARFSELSSWSVDSLLRSQDSPYATSEYKQVRLQEVADINPRTDMSMIEGNEYVSFIPMEDISDIYGEWIGEKIIKKEGIKGYTKFQDGDLLWARITPCMQNGKSAIVKNLENNRGCGSTEFHIVRVHANSVIPEYLHILFRQDELLKDAQRYFTGSAGQQRVPASYLSNLAIPVPPISVQEQIINCYNQFIDNIKTCKDKANHVMGNAKSSFETQIFE